MPKFTLISEHEDGAHVTVEFEKEYLPDILMHVDMFLRGTGFVYDGALAIEEYEPAQIKEDEYYSSEKCRGCGLTKDQLGGYVCYDNHCPSKINDKWTNNAN
jgi:hypothetical protein